jgi:methyltransferase (TIGR00027 family)
MQPGQPSRSAHGMALHRAAHQLLDEPLVFDDPFALPIIGENGSRTIRERAAWHRANAPIRAYTIGRSRYTEDALAEAVRARVGQYVVLGAGLDTFAYRNPHGLRVIEADSPATQAWKRSLLSRAGIAIPHSLRFAPIDFENETLAEGLAKAGFRPDAPAFFSFLGVAVFLAPETLARVARFVAALPKGSALVFDYGVPADALDADQLAERRTMAAELARVGEPMRSFFDTDALAQALRHLGYREIEDLGYREMNARYFAGRADGLQVGRNGRRLIHARV